MGLKIGQKIRISIGKTYINFLVVGLLRGGGRLTPLTTKQKKTFFSINSAQKWGKRKKLSKSVSGYSKTKKSGMDH